jgi:hypothetical protein
MFGRATKSRRNVQIVSIALRPPRGVSLSISVPASGTRAKRGSKSISSPAANNIMNTWLDITVNVVNWTRALNHEPGMVDHVIERVSRCQ